jgi:hypothetical protein
MHIEFHVSGVLFKGGTHNEVDLGYGIPRKCMSYLNTTITVIASVICRAGHHKHTETRFFDHIDRTNSFQATDILTRPFPEPIV